MLRSCTTPVNDSWIELDLQILSMTAGSKGAEQLLVNDSWIERSCHMEDGLLP
jgi:hypothetical protein